MLQGMELSGAVGHFSGGLDNSSFGSCSSFLAHDTNEATSASSWVAQDADDAMSEPSWTALTKRKERDWWGIDLEGEMAKLEVVCPWSRTEGGSVDPKGEIGSTKFANEGRRIRGSQREDWPQVSSDKVCK